MEHHGNPIMQAILFGWVFWTSLSLGCFGLTLLHHAVRGSWSLPLLRVIEAGTKMLPILGIVFVAFMLVGLKQVYPHWAYGPGDDEILARKTWWLNTPRFLISSVLYFAIWFGFARYLTRSSELQDKTGDERLAAKRATVAAWGLVVYILTMTLAWTDWVMSLDPHWFSTIFGLLWVVGSGLLALAFCTVFVIMRQRQTPWNAVAVNPSWLRDMGNMMIAFCMLWAYANLSQFLIIYSGNLPEEATYYLERGFGQEMGPWNILSSFVLVGQFFFPFLALLSGRTKRTPSLLFGIASWILLMRLLDVYNIVVPFFHPHGVAELGMPLLLWAIFGAVWIGGFSFFFKQAPAPVPSHDPRIEEILHPEAAH